MIINSPQIFEDGNSVILWSKIELDQKVNRFPEILWYRIPRQYGKYISKQSDSFIVASILPAMLFGENIDILGTVSPQLAYNLIEYMSWNRFLHPDLFKPIELNFENLDRLNAQPDGICTTFSGGVDSFFAIDQHLPANQDNPNYHLTHTLFLNSFDIPKKDHDKYQQLFKTYQSLMKNHNIELVGIDTNQVNFIIPWLPYIPFHSTILASSVMTMGKLFKYFILPGDADYHQLKILPNDSNPLSDRLLSTETLQVIPYGAAFRRVEKVEKIIDLPMVQEHLRVCGLPSDQSNGHNCSRCEKCMRTMIALYILDKMNSFNTFSKPIRRNRDLLWWARKFNPAHLYVHETFLLAKKHKPNILPWLWAAAVLGYIRYWILKIIPEFIKPALKPLGFYHDPLLEENAFEDPILIEQLRNQLT
ncbi:MAG: hypothetical protein JEZ06_04380 [Anaerolineaceae bacterium]|nr:hypothetical protein [Anaerolineaceae bacterium]